MARVPEPVQTPAGPAYEGRLLHRPGDEVVDQGVSFDLRTLISRRAVLSLLGAGLGAAALAACGGAGGASESSSAAASSATAAGELPAAEIPDETAGPYPGDGSNGPDVLEQTGIVRSDIRSNVAGGTAVEGVPLTFTLTVTDMANGDAPFTGVAVYAWHCDARGRYSMYSAGVENETWLRGVQVADANGRVSFTSIFPGCYSGRWPHIHFEVYPDLDSTSDHSKAIATSQLALTESACLAVYARSGYDGSAQNLAEVTLAGDNVFGEDAGALQLATVTGDAATGYTAALTARVDTSTKPSGGAAPGGGAPGGGMPPGGASRGATPPA